MKIPVPDAPRRGPRFGFLASIVLLVGMLATVMPAAAPSPARAASYSHGVSFGGWEVGAFLSSTGQLVYCVEPGASEPRAAQNAPVPVGTLTGYTTQARDETGWNGTVSVGPVSGESLRRMNWLLTKHGQSADPGMAAVVQIAIWMLRYDAGTSPWLDHHFGWIAAHGGGDHLAHARSLLAEAEAATGPRSTPVPEAELSLALDAEQGRGRVDYPAGTTAITLEGAVFEGGGAELRVDGGAAGSASWTTELHAEGWQREHRVTATGEWNHVEEVWPAEVMLHSATEANQQDLGSMVGPLQDAHRAPLGPVSAVIDTRFAPVLSTRTDQPIVERGTGRFSDLVTLSTLEGETPWASRRHADGSVEYAPVVAEGVLYGPFSHPQAVADHAPQGAPVAGRARLIADRGPGEYRAEIDAAPGEAGYYSWVWRIDESEQRPEVRAAGLLPSGYGFADRFGLPEEGQTVPSTLHWSTELESRELALDSLVLRDRLTASLRHGAWLRDENGSRIPARIRLTVYGSAEEPVRAPQPPPGVGEIARVFADIDSTGELEVAPIELPFETRGWVTVQACLLSEDQSEEHRGLIAEWCDDFGVPSETARISVPTVRTEAQPSAVVGEAFGDVAFVDGLVPAGAELGFAYYLAPAAGEPKYDERWEPRTDENGEPVLWEETELAAMTEEERCLAQPVATTARVEVRAAGRVSSPRIVARSTGVGYWVEDLTMPHPETGERVELHRGACGLENERTEILDQERPLPAPNTSAATELSATGGVDPRFALLGVVPLAGAGLTMLLAARRRSGGAGLRG